MVAVAAQVQIAILVVVVEEELAEEKVVDEEMELEDGNAKKANKNMGGDFKF